ncbi:exodeoxyribonuclease VII large subunit [Butyrivibrio sp. NC3005]|uniref:exodeoxyribonuclease VII large subunit n=1 Tax=Butyrivibrio sp. NC3005 TaxID=1280685 RepID=UPI001FA7BF16
MFEQDFLLNSITVKGEVSNCKYHSSGHIYFTLKDSSGAINCVMFRGNRKGLSFELQEGQQVLVSGSVNVYIKGGSYQLYATSISQDGDGQLYEEFEKLKNRLEEQGMFALEYKQKIPRFIHTLGIVTASTGAAVHDIINITTRRNPHVQIILYPAIVQGEEAPASIIKGIETLSSMNVDVMIVGRGGGSIEDLWAFNDENVAQAIFDCPIPIISAVGHETDTTIADFVADLRAPTPSAAAELAVFEWERFENDLRDYAYTLHNLQESRLEKVRNNAIQKARTLWALSPVMLIRQQKIKKDEYTQKLTLVWNQFLQRYKNRLNLQIETMKGLSPLNKLQSGYSYVENADKVNVRSIEDVVRNDKIKIHVTDGIISATVDDVSKS